MGLIDRMRGRRRVVMLLSVSGTFDSEPYSLEAGSEHWLHPGLADKFIANSWASGELSRDYAVHELPALRGSQQVVDLGS